MQSIKSAHLMAAAALAMVTAAGCNQRLTVDDVKELIKSPKGTVSKDSMTRVTRDLFQADRATSIEGIADLLKTNQSSSSGSNAIPGLSAGVLEDTGDVFCVGGLVASIASFDACKTGDDCHAELTLDSCVLRVGDEGADEDARGKIHFKLDSETGGDADVSDLALSFEGWQSSRDDKALDSLDGLIELQTDIKHDDSTASVVFASDIDARVINKEHGFFEDGVTDHTHVVAGLQFQSQTTDTEGSGSLDILAFTDEDASQHNESVVIHIDAAVGHQVDAAAVTSDTASANISVIGENGTFSCSWTAADTTGTPEGEKVSSEGHCVDEDGETFDFSGEATSSS